MNNNHAEEIAQDIQIIRDEPGDPMDDEVRFEMPNRPTRPVGGNICLHIKLEVGSNSFHFRNEEYRMAAVGVPNFNAFTVMSATTGIVERIWNRYDYLKFATPILNHNGKTYRITVQKSDYGRSKLYKGRGNNITLYVADTSDFDKDEKTTFVMPENHLYIKICCISF